MFVIALARGVPLLQSTYPNKVIGLITLKSTSTRTEYTLYLNAYGIRALYSTYTFYTSIIMAENQNQQPIESIGPNSIQIHYRLSCINFLKA